MDMLSGISGFLFPSEAIVFGGAANSSTPAGERGYLDPCGAAYRLVQNHSFPTPVPDPSSPEFRDLVWSSAVSCPSMHPLFPPIPQPPARAIPHTSSRLILSFTQPVLFDFLSSACIKSVVPSCCYQPLLQSSRSIWGGTGLWVSGIEKSFSHCRHRRVPVVSWRTSALTPGHMELGRGQEAATQLSLRIPWEFQGWLCRLRSDGCAHVSHLHADETCEF